MVAVTFQVKEEAMNGSDQFLGIVQDGKFQRLQPAPGSGGPARFTSIQPQQAVAPESGELDLTQHEGRAIMIRGHEQGEWVFSAEVVEEAGPILTAVVQELFGGKESWDD
jgi:hypothetical protein